MGEPGREIDFKEARDVRSGPSSGPVVKINRNFTLKSGDPAEFVVVIGGDATIDG